MRLGEHLKVKREEKDLEMTPRCHVGERIQEERWEVQSRAQ